MRKLLKTGSIVLFIAALCAAPAFAEDIIETEAVKVTVNRVEQELHETNVSAAVVTDEEIRRDPAPNVAEQLKSIPGVAVLDGGMAGMPRISIRGESASRTLIMIDGVKISEHKSMDGAPVLINTANIERIEVIKGPASVLYGSEAIGGVVNIITKKGGNKPIGASARLTYDSSTNSLEPVGSVFGRYEGFNYRVSGSYIDADNRKTPDGKIKFSSYRRTNYSAHAGYDWDWGKVFAGYDYFKGIINVPYDADAQIMKLHPWERETFSGGVEFNNFSDYLLNVKLTGYFQNTRKFQDMSMFPYSFAMGYGLINNDMDSYGASLQTDWLLLDDHYVILGADFNHDNLDTWTRNIDTNTTVTADGQQSNLGIYIQDEWSILEQLKLVGGVRYTWIKTKANDDNLGKNDSTDDNLVANIGAVYMPTDDLAFRANVSQGYKSPTLSQLYIGNFGGTMLPNKDLKPEKSTNYEIGVRYNDGAWNVDAALYYADAKDFIASRTISTNISQYQNLDKAKTWGFELGADYTYKDLGLTPYVVFNWMQRETTDKLHNLTTKKNLFPEFTGQVGVKWQGDLMDEHTFFADLNYFWNGRAKNEYYFRGNRVVDTYPSFGTVNLNLGFESHHEDSINYFGSISLNNMLDKEYTPATSALMAPGFHAVITGGVTF